MAALPVLALVSLTGLLGVLAVAAVRSLRDGTPHPAIPQRLLRRTAAWRWAGILTGAAVAYLSFTSGALGRGMLLAAPLFGACVLIGVLLGEYSVRPSGGSTRRAVLEVRQVRDYLPPWLSRAVGVAGCVLFGLLVATTAAGAPDDLGRPGRRLVRTCDAIHSEGHGPWAGSFYSVPLAILVGVCVLAAGAALRQIVRRPRPEGTAGQIIDDDVLRRHAADAVMGACGVLITIPLIGVSQVTAGGLLAIDCAPAWWRPAATLLILSVPLWVALLGWSAATVLLPRRHHRVAAP